ncbi:MAG: DUF721 domain-containing protein [Kiritimatiellia bacterium]
MKRRRGSLKKSDGGKWQLHRERCRLRGSETGFRSGEAVAIGDVVPSVMKKLGIESQHWLTVMNTDWEKLVGPEVARHTRPGRFERGRLTVFVDSSVWLNELARYGREEMLSNLRREFGGKRVKSLNLRLDPDGGRRG